MHSTQSVASATNTVNWVASWLLRNFDFSVRPLTLGTTAWWNFSNVSSPHKLRSWPDRTSPLTGTHMLNFSKVNCILKISQMSARHTGFDRHLIAPCNPLGLIGWISQQSTVFSKFLKCQLATQVMIKHEYTVDIWKIQPMSPASDTRNGCCISSVMKLASTPYVCVSVLGGGGGGKGLGLA